MLIVFKLDEHRFSVPDVYSFHLDFLAVCLDQLHRAHPSWHDEGLRDPGFEEVRIYALIKLSSNIAAEVHFDLRIVDELEHLKTPEQNRLHVYDVETCRIDTLTHDEFDVNMLN